MSKFTDAQIKEYAAYTSTVTGQLAAELLAAREEIERLRSLIEDLPLNNELGDT